MLVASRDGGEEVFGVLRQDAKTISSTASACARGNVDRGLV